MAIKQVPLQIAYSILLHRLAKIIHLGKVLMAMGLLLALPITARGYPCVKYAFHFFGQSSREDLPPGDLTLTWRLNTLGSACGFSKEKIETKRFIVSVSDLFEQPFIVDTVDSPLLNFRLKKDEAVIVNVKELGSDHEIHLMIAQREHSFKEQPSKIDSLNWALMNGYFAHANALLYKLNRKELIPKIIEQHELLFPIDYRGSNKLFNTYFDPTIDDLVQMPYLTGIEEFVKKLRQQVELPEEVDELMIEASVGDNAKVIDLVTTPPVDNASLVEAMNLLTIDAHNVRNAKFLLLFDTRRRSWKLVNERAVTDPSTKAFKLRTKLRAGAIH